MMINQHAALCGANQGCPYVIACINDPVRCPLMEPLGFDAYIHTPLVTTVSSILRHIVPWSRARRIYIHRDAEAE